MLQEKIEFTAANGNGHFMLRRFAALQARPVLGPNCAIFLPRMISVKESLQVSCEIQ